MFMVHKLKLQQNKDEYLNSTKNTTKTISLSKSLYFRYKSLSQKVNKNTFLGVKIAREKPWLLWDFNPGQKNRRRHYNNWVTGTYTLDVDTDFSRKHLPSYKEREGERERDREREIAEPNHCVNLNTSHLVQCTDFSGFSYSSIISPSIQMSFGRVIFNCNTLNGYYLYPPFLIGLNEEKIHF